MTLKEKLQQEKIYINPYNFKLTNESVEKFEQITDEFAIGFAEWVMNNCDEFPIIDQKLILKVYKKEKEL